MKPTAPWRRHSCLPRRDSSRRLVLVCLILAVTATIGAQQKALETVSVARATLDNGMRVIVVRDPLAPVVTVEQNYLAGGDETPAGFPGTAHAQEHMSFRGCRGVAADQIAAIYAQLGGDNDADTQQTITQYFATVPAADLDLALHVDSACMAGVEDTQTEWAKEKGAIEQEVARDLSNPTYKFLTRLNADIFAGTPYEHDALGTHASFEATTAPMLKKFYETWYAPNNALLVISGDVDPQSAMNKVKQYYGAIPRHAVPTRPQINLKPVKSENFTLDSNLPYTLVFIAFRTPGTDSPDYAAARVLADVLSSQRANLYDLVVQGKALAAEFGMAEEYPQASVAFSAAAVASGSNPGGIVTDMRRVLQDYATKGVPADLVEAAKRGELADAEFQRNSIPGLANAWSRAVAAEGRNSPDDDVAAIRKVTLADVNRVAARILVASNSVTATLVPKPSGEAVAEKGFGGGEKLTSTPTKPVVLPDWAGTQLAKLEVPKENLHVTDERLPNGLRLIVKSIAASPTVTVLGNVRHEANLEEPAGKDGVGDVLEQIMTYGTKTLDRLAFQKALDDIAASESAGYNFTVRVLKGDFSRGVQLLADNQLNPAFPEMAFKVVQDQVSGLAAGNLKSPEYRAGRAATKALVPPNDPDLRETTPKTVGTITLDDVKRYHERTMRPDLTTIVVIGDVTPADARSVIEKWFGAWRASGPKPETTLPPIPRNKPSAATVPDPSSLQDNVTVAEEIDINRYSPDYYPLTLGNHVLGGGFYATRLYRDLRENTGYVYSVDVQLDASRSRAVYEVVYGCDPGNTSKALGLVMRDVSEMQMGEVSPGELQQAKALLLRQIPLREASEEALGGGFLARAQMDLPLDEPFEAAKRYYAMTGQEVRDAFRRHVRADGFAEVVRGPAPK
ncbi:MAG TPA: pitrilysin family protein [Bryobacteraceae bacterium]|nr:pitrilysin family protein [Bryobacteraceae bacterium]